MHTSEFRDITPAWIREYVLYSWNGICMYILHVHIYTSGTWAAWFLRRFPFAVSIFHSRWKGRTRPSPPYPPSLPPFTDYPRLFVPDKRYFVPYRCDLWCAQTPGAKRDCYIICFEVLLNVDFVSFFHHFFVGKLLGWILRWEGGEKGERRTGKYLFQYWILNILGRWRFENTLLSAFGK